MGDHQVADWVIGQLGRKHARPSRHLGIPHGHESGPLLMTGMHGPNPVPASVKCIKQGIELDTRNPQHRINPVCEQSFNYRLRAV